jgi:hypothetical protein
MKLLGFFGGFLGLRLLRLRSFSAETDASDLDTRQLPSMANGPMIAFSATILEGDDLLVLALLNYFSRDSGAIDEWTAVREVVAIAMEQDVAKSGFLARFAFEQIDIDYVALGDAMLSAACFDNCVSHSEGEFSGGKAAQIHTDRQTSQAKGRGRFTEPPAPRVTQQDQRAIEVNRPYQKSPA